jgi:biopolymer transport protein TolR
MGMGVGGKSGGAMSQINMTPMIDVLLVLLIIFMVVQQALQRGVSVQVPPPPDQNQVAQQAPEDQIVLEVKSGPVFAINQQVVAADALEARLREVFATRNRKVIFVKGEENLHYGDVIKAVDASRGAGITIVGLVPRPAVGPATVVAP